MKPYHKLSAVDIFCGCGGLSEGFAQAGFDIILGIDIDAWAIKTYNKFQGNRGRVKDVREVNAGYIYSETEREKVDVLIGGPPCQAFSNIGVAKWRSVGMPSTIKHPLNTLYKEFLRLVLDVNPKFFVIENVERMLSIKEGIVKRTIELALKGKYYVSFYVKDVSDFGVPQHRKRVLVIGNRFGLDNPLLEPTHSGSDHNKKPYITVRDAIADLPVIKHSNGKDRLKYRRLARISEYALQRRFGSGNVSNHVSRPHNTRDLKIFSMLSPGQSINHLPEYYNPYRNDVFKDKYKKQPWNKPSSTILAHLSKDGLMFIHPDGRQNRTLTPREAARLQSFADILYLVEFIQAHPELHDLYKKDLRELFGSNKELDGIYHYKNPGGPLERMIRAILLIEVGMKRELDFRAHLIKSLIWCCLEGMQSRITNGSEIQLMVSDTHLTWLWSEMLSNRVKDDAATVRRQLGFCTLKYEKV